MAHETDPLSAKAWWSRVDASRKFKKDYLQTWRDSVSYREGKPFKNAPPEDTVNVPADWSRTKNKIGQLFYQIPEVVLKARRPEWMSVASTYAAALNFELTEKIHAEHMMNECLGDLVNAAGVMACYVSYSGEFEDVEMPLASAGEVPSVEGEVMPPAAPPGLPPMGGAAMGDVPDAAMGGAPPPPEVPVVEGEVMPETTTVPRPVYECYEMDRVSPAHLVWPVEFVGSNFQKAAFLGFEGYLPLAEAIRRKWVGEDAEGVEMVDPEWLLTQDQNDFKPTDKFIKYVMLFYHPHTYDSAEKDPRKIKKVVLVEDGRGEKTKAVDEDFKWQKKSPDGRWIGMTTYPIKVGTIAHISDKAIPPSDSEIGRPQVKELIKSRTQMIRQRDHSMPLRWFDVNQVDGIVAEKLRRGKWQDMIPMNGPGDRAIGEVARAQYPPENWNFDKTIKADLDESWSMGNMQQGITSPGETTATEVKEISGANDVRLDYERQWVLRFFLETAQAVGALMQMFADDEQYAWVVGESGLQELKAWNKDLIPGEYIFAVRPDSQLRLDVNQRRQEGLNLYKLLRKDPLIDAAPLVRRVLEDHGLDAGKMIKPPAQPQPPPNKVSASFKGEDLLNPLAIAFINKGPTPITDADVKAAQALIASIAPPAPVAPVPGAMPGGGAPGGQPPHPGPADVVQALDKRYEQGGDHGAEGSRDSGMPAPPR